MLYARLILLLSALLVGACSCEPPPEEDAGPDPEPPAEDAGEPARADAGTPPEQDAGEPPVFDAGPGPEVLCPPDDDLEPNDARAEARDTEAGELLEAISCNDDWFALTVGAGCEAIATLTLPASGQRADLDLHVFDRGDGQLIDANTAPAAEKQVNAFGGAAGRELAFRVRGPELAGQRYTFAIRELCADDLVCPDDDPFEDNDDQATPAALPLEEETVGIVCAEDDDFYLADVAEGCALAVDLDFVDDDGDLDLRLLDPEGNAISSGVSTNDDERVAAVRSLGDPSPVIRVSGFNGAENSYEILARVRCESDLVCPGDDLFEPNDDRPSAFRLPRDGGEAVGIICESDDFYRFTGTSGCTVEATLEFTHADGNLSLRLLDTSDTTLASSFSVDDNESITHVLEAGGTKTFRVNGVGNAENRYRLSFVQLCE